MEANDHQVSYHANSVWFDSFYGTELNETGTILIDNERNILLSSGYFRWYNINPTDISLITYRYLGNVQAKFKVKNHRNVKSHFNFTTLLIKHNYTHNHKRNYNYNYKRNTRHNPENIPIAIPNSSTTKDSSSSDDSTSTNNITTHTYGISIELKRCYCIGPYKNNGYEIQCGLFGILKNKIDTKLKEKTFEKTFQEYLNYRSMNIHTMYAGFAKYKNDKYINWVKNKQEMVSYWIHISNLNNSKYSEIGIAMAKTPSLISAKVELKQGDTIDVCIENEIANNNDSNEIVCSSLYFVKNSENIVNISAKGDNLHIKQTIDNEASHRILLDTSKYYYYFGVSSVVCNCKKSKSGWKFGLKFIDVHDQSSS